MTRTRIALLAVVTLLGLVAVGVAIAAADAPSEAARPTTAVDDDDEPDDDTDDAAETSEVDDNAAESGDDVAERDDDADDADDAARPRVDDADQADPAEENVASGVADRAGAAALEAAGGGTVTEVEREASGYEVEVTRSDGSEADVNLDQAFRVVSVDQDD
jgi:hypothetical protein